MIEPFIDPDNATPETRAKCEAQIIMNDVEDMLTYHTPIQVLDKSTGEIIDHKLGLFHPLHNFVNGLFHVTRKTLEHNSVTKLNYFAKHATVNFVLSSFLNELHAENPLTKQAIKDLSQLDFNMEYETFYEPLLCDTGRIFSALFAPILIPSHHRVEHDIFTRDIEMQHRVRNVLEIVERAAKKNATGLSPFVSIRDDIHPPLDQLIEELALSTEHSNKDITMQQMMATAWAIIEEAMHTELSAEAFYNKYNLSSEWGQMMIQTAQQHTNYEQARVNQLGTPETVIAPRTVNNDTRPIIGRTANNLLH